MHRGYVQLWRKLKDWEWFGSAETLQVFIFLLLEANHAQKNWRGIIIEPGQLITSLPSIAKATHLSVRTVRTCINRLKSTGEITNTSTNKYRLITVVNKGKYSPTKIKTTGKTTGNLTVERQASDSQSTATNNYRELINTNKKIESITPKTESFILEVKAVASNRDYPLKEIEKFCSYWTEPNKTKTKLRWELQPTFDIARRLVTWMGRSNQFNNSKGGLLTEDSQ